MQTECRRATFDAKLVTTTLPCFSPINLTRLAATSDSEPDSFLEHVGRVANHGEDAVAPQLLQFRLVIVGADHRVRIKLPVASMKDRSDTGADRDAVRLGYRVREGDQFDIEYADLSSLTQIEHMDFRLVLETVLSKLFPNEVCGEGSRVDRRAQSRPEPADGANVILVRMGDQNAVDLRLPFFQERRVRQDQVDAGQTIVRKRHADIDDQPPARIRWTIRVGVEVHADFTAAAQRQEDQFVVLHHYAWPGGVALR